VITVLVKSKRYRRFPLLSSYVKIIQDMLSTDERKHSRPYVPDVTPYDVSWNSVPFINVSLQYRVYEINVIALCTFVCSG